MKAIRWLFKMTPFRISLYLTLIFLALYIWKARSTSELEVGVANPVVNTLELMEMKAYDLRFQLTNRLWPPKPSDKVVIAAIDDKALAHYDWPFPRSINGDLVLNLQKYGARVVAFDVIWGDLGQYEGLQFIEEVEKKYKDFGLNAPPEVPKKMESDDLAAYFNKVSGFGEYLEQQRKAADQNAQLANDLKQTHNVILGWYYYRSNAEAEENPDNDYSDNAEAISSSSISFSLSSDLPLERFVHRMWVIRSFGMWTPIPVLAQSSELFGFFTSTPDNIDGTIRRAPLVTYFTLDEENPTVENTHLYPALALASLSYVEDEKPLVSADKLGLKVSLKGHVIPTDKYGRILIDWMGPVNTFPYYSIYDINTGFKDDPQIDPYKLFKDKIVFVGSSAIGAHDMRTTPFGTMPGVEMHANVASNILQKDYLVRPEWFGMFDIFFILVVGILLGIALPRLSAVWGGIITLVLLGGYGGMNLFFFVEKHYTFTIIFPLAELLFIYTGITIFRYATEEREKRFIKGAFEHYLSPKVITQLMDNPAMLNLGGERKQLTAFFSDIQGFSSFSEQMEPEDLVQFLNVYLTEMCDIILDHDGTIDKFEGDAIIAFFGAPIHYEDHAVRACLSAVSIQQRMVELRKRWVEEGRPEIHMRIGLNTGDMVVGNMGSADRMDYTIMGDAVNLAARLEMTGKQYKLYTLISEYTYRAAKDVIEVREIDTIRVVGKTEPVRVYEILGKKGEVNEKMMSGGRLYEEGLNLYRQCNWDQAIEKFERAREINPADNTSKVFIERCKEYKINPPPPGWDGVYTMTKK